ncbi:MAG: NnrS family protein, partial [Gammaproteobacteria bacterium]|nr:NnrS family protein [Gammaproteobacteria bacterium]
MLERTLPPFMQRAFRIVLPRNHWLDGAIRLLGFVLIFERLLPPPLAGGLAIALATLLVVRLAFWSPHRALRQIEVGIMVLGYGMLVVQLLIAAPALALHPAWVGAVPVHLFAFGVMGLIIPAMQVRIAKGHTGRDPVFDRTDRMVLWLMLLALGARVVAPQIFPTGYSVWLALAAGCWFAGFATLAVRYSPFLLQARVDGRKY